MRSPEQLKSPNWHSLLESSDTGRWRSLVELAIPLAVVVIFWSLGWQVMAMVVAGIALLLVILRQLAPAMRVRVDRVITQFAEWLGAIASVVLLAVPFFLVMPWIRLWNYCAGRDVLRLRNQDLPSAWLAADEESRRTRCIQRMFCSERLERKGFSLPVLLGLLGMFLVAAEVGLRIYGMGSPILFVQDPDIGYYPMPNQTARYPGRTVRINQLSMRAEAVQLPKPADRVRVLLIGDSTLAGTKVSNEELYTYHLQQLLNRKAGRDAFEVLNLGVNAWGPLHEAAFIEKFGTFDADIAIICGPIANCFRPKYGLERLPFSPSTHPPKLALEHVVYELMWRVREQVLGPPPWALPGSHQDRQAEIGTQGYLKLGRLFQLAGCEVHMEMLPARSVTLGQGDDPHGKRFFTHIEAEMATIGVSPRCAGAIFRNEVNREEIYHDGVHFDVRGHQLYASYLADQLISHSATVRQHLKSQH